MEQAVSVRQFKKAHPELKGKRIILCEHLRNKSVNHVNLNLFIGDDTRVLLCPVCTKICTMTAWEHMVQGFMFLLEASNDLNKSKYNQWLETAAKE